MGRGALAKQKEAGVPRSSIGLRVDEPGRHIPRPGCEVLVNGEIVGRVTSGTIRQKDAHAVRVHKTFV